MTGPMPMFGGASIQTGHSARFVVPLRRVVVVPPRVPFFFRRNPSFLWIVLHSAGTLTGRENASMSSRRVMSGCSSIFASIRADQQIEAQREPPSLRGPKGRGNPVGRVDCHVASLLAMTIGLIGAS
jgi:hypothetical protein